MRASERLGARAQVDDACRSRARRSRRAGLRDRAAAERDHGAAPGERLDRGALARAEARLALAREELRDAAPASRLDLAIEVDEGQPEPARERGADGATCPRPSCPRARACRVCTRADHNERERSPSPPLERGRVRAAGRPAAAGARLALAADSGFTTMRGVTNTRSSWRTSRVSLFLKAFPSTGILWKYGTRDWRSAVRTT